MESKEIVIRPVVRPKFSGISKHSNTGTVITTELSMKTGLYKNGLTLEEEIEYEVLLNLPKGTLGKRSSYWGEMDVRLKNDKATYFSIESPLDEIKYKLMLASSKIANNELELSKSPQAEFYIEDAEAKAKIEEVAIDLVYEATQILMGTTLDEKKGYLKLYGAKMVDTLSERVVKTELFKKVNADPKRFIDMSTDPDIKVRILIEDMIEKGLVKKKGSYYSYENEVIGNSVDAVVSFFKDLKHQSLKITMEQSLKNTKKGKE